MKKILPCLFIVFGISSCNIYKSYERPDMDVSDDLYRQTSVQEDTVSLAMLSWRELFTDENLQALIDTGLKNNTDLEIARLKVKEAEALLLSSKLAYVPSLSLSAQGTLNSVGGAAPSKSYELAASSEWEIDIFGKLLNAKRGAKAALEQSEAYRQAVQTQLVATIANSYYTLLMQDEQLRIMRRTAETWEDNVRVMKAMKEAGQTTEMAVAQVEASRLSVEASIVSTERQINEMENSLSVLLGLSPQQIKRSTLDAQSFPDTLSTGVPLQLLSRRPDVKQAEQALAVAYYATNQARSAFYPSNRGKNIANLEIAKAQQQEALLSFKQSLLNAGAEVNDALMQWQSARKRIELDKQQTEALESALRSSELLMQYSSQNYLEVITARQALLQAELNIVNDRFDRIQGVINLYHALGGGY